MTARTQREYKGPRPDHLWHRSAVTVRSFLSFLALIGLLALAPLTAIAQSTPRAAEHDGFGRMVFDWDAPLRWSADVVNNELVLRFEKPVAGDPRALLKPLGKYLKSVTISPDRRMVSFPLAVPVQVKSFTTGNSTVVDLLETAQPTASVAQPAPPAKAAAGAPAEPAVDLMVRGGEHTGFNRLVFDWPQPVGYSVNLADGKVVVSFDRPARLNATALEASLPADVKFVETRPAGKGTAVVLALPADMRVRHFTTGPRVALDLVRPAGSPPPPRAAGTPAPPLAPAPGASEQPPALKPLAQEPAPTPPVEDLAKRLPPPRPEAAPPAAAPAQAAPAAATPAGPAATAPAPAAPTAQVASMGVPFDQPTAAAAFRRGGWLWLVFDRKVEVDVKLLKRTGGELVRQVEQVPDVSGGTAIRMVTRPGFNPSVRKEGLLWVFDLAEQPLYPKIPLAIDRQFDFEDRGRLMVASTGDAAQKAVLIRDPEVGDTFQVMPVMAVGAGVRSPVGLPALDLLATAQGIAMVPKADGVRLDAKRGGIEGAEPGGRVMSRDQPPVAGKVE
ncbi:MAG: hypothetical protein ACM33T_10080, partial [Solirubrobacterales bacterium]